MNGPYRVVSTLPGCRRRSARGWQRHCTWIAPHCSHRARASNGMAVLLSSTLAAAAAIKCADWLNVHPKRASQACARAGQARLS